MQSKQEQLIWTEMKDRLGCVHWQWIQAGDHRRKRIIEGRGAEDKEIQIDGSKNRMKINNGKEDRRQMVNRQKIEVKQVQYYVREQRRKYSDV